MRRLELWVQELVELAERMRVVERAGAGLTVVAGAFGSGEVNEGLVAGQCLDELWCGCADVVSLGVSAAPAVGFLLKHVQQPTDYPSRSTPTARASARRLSGTSPSVARSRSHQPRSERQPELHACRPEIGAGAQVRKTGRLVMPLRRPLRQPGHRFGRRLPLRMPASEIVTADAPSDARHSPMSAPQYSAAPTARNSWRPATRLSAPSEPSQPPPIRLTSGRASDTQPCRSARESAWWPTLERVVAESHDLSGESLGDPQRARSVTNATR